MVQPCKESLRRLGYVATRQRGSHMRITTQLDGEHHGSDPMRHPIGVETLVEHPESIAQYYAMTVEELLRELAL